MGVEYGILLGLWGTSLVHLAKGIESLSLRRRKTALYILGLILDMSSVVWLTIANIFAPPSYYTSMYGFGLVVLLLYSQYVIGDHVSKEEWGSAGILIAGTGLLGISSIFTPQPPFYEIDVSRLFRSSIALGIVLLIILIVALRKGDRVLLGIAFGIIAGASASLEPIYRAVGQTIGTTSTSLFPKTPEGTIIFIGSFLGSILGLIFTQIAFSKKCPATSVIPSFNAVYIILPHFILLYSLSGYKISTTMAMGFVFTLLGILLINYFQIRRSNREKKRKASSSPPNEFT